MANYQLLLYELKYGCYRQTVVVHLLRYWEISKVKEGVLDIKNIIVMTTAATAENQNMQKRDQHVMYPIHRNKKSKQNFRRKIKIATLTCHTYRAMYLAVSPDGQKIEMVQRSGFDRIASAFSSPPLDTPTADHQITWQ
ncbi:hypothetical protein Bca52824_018270 [Brassica carinata]|uniref:Uncharacterized protein n=1 Tax=Brassica carinata TaxID=52824 RepID=A0A8X7VQ52_BRACI|nr:hypothetical protein Bca52824_018270 [Brassica carinata]